MTVPGVVLAPLTIAPPPLALALAGLVLVGGLVVVAVPQAVRDGSITRRGSFGIRHRDVTLTDERFRAGHVAAERSWHRAAWVGLATTVVTVLLLATTTRAVSLVAALVGVIVFAVLVRQGVRRAVQAVADLPRTG